MSLLALRALDPVDAAIDHLYQQIEDGTRRIQRSPFAIDEDALRERARQAGLFAGSELRELTARVRAQGLEVRPVERHAEAPDLARSRTATGRLSAR